MSRQQTDIQESYARLSELQKAQESKRSRARVQMLMLLHDNPERSLSDVAREIGVAERSVIRWWRTYREGGLDALLETRHRGRPSRLHAVGIDEIRTKIAAEGMGGLEEIRGWLSAEYGLEYSRSGVSYALREILGARRSSGWLLLDDPLKPADGAENGDSLTLDNPNAVIALLNALPMTDDVVEWGNGFRAILHRLLPDVDRISVNVNRSCDMMRPERYVPGTLVRRFVGDREQGESVSIETLKTDESPSERILNELRSKGVPLSEFHTPIARDYFFGGTAYLGTIFLWRQLANGAIPAPTTLRLDQLEPFVVFSLSDLVSRHQVMQPTSGVFFEAAQRMFEDAGLSKSEKRIVMLQLLGHSYKEIADIVSVSLDAVKKHFHVIYRKTGTRGQADLFAKYFTAQLRREQSEVEG
jgi:transposase